MLTVLLALSLIPVGPNLQSVMLSRKFSLGELLTYKAKADFTVEQRSGSLLTFIPENEEMEYLFSIDVQKMKGDGIAEVVYKRPTLKIAQYDLNNPSGKLTTQQLNWTIGMNVSSANEMIGMKDLSPPKKPAIKPGDQLRSIYRQGGIGDRVALNALFSFIGELQRVAFFVGPIDSGLDIAPLLPYEEVKIGETWQRTVGFTPQKLKGQDKTMVQRLDYTYTYEGIKKDRDGKDVQRIHAEVKLETDMTDFAKVELKSAGVNPEGGGSFLKSIPVRLSASIDFDLDMKTMHTIRAVASSKGGFEVNAKGADIPVIEQKFGGKTTVVLQSIGKSAPAKIASPKSSGKKPGKGS